MFSVGGGWRILGLSRDALERSWSPLGYHLGVWGEHLQHLGMIVLSQGGVRRENNEKLESDDLLNENAMFLRSQGLPNDTHMQPKLAERSKKIEKKRKGSKELSLIHI